MRERVETAHPNPYQGLDTLVNPGSHLSSSISYHLASLACHSAQPVVEQEFIIMSAPVQSLKSARGAFIVLEGIDRCGKTTQCTRLLEYLQRRNVRFRVYGPTQGQSRLDGLDA
jgi:hypothetical protein